MRIQYCSDLHLEFEQNNKYLTGNPLSVKGDILILAGDITHLDEKYFNNPFFSWASDHYQMVFWVPGNHEFYYKDVSEFSSSFHIGLKNNISIVYNVDLHYNNIHFVFSTLWSRISEGNEKKIEQSVSDFEWILKNDRKLRAADFNQLHEECLRFLQRSLDGREGKIVVVTHQLPSRLCNSAVHKNSPINEAFCVDLTEFIEKSNVNFWIYGHNHYNRNALYIGNTILLTNQLGYVHCSETGQFKHNAYFSV